jgi:UPF0716 protein FxsA
MRFGLLLVLIAVPLLELALLIKLGTLIGLWPTVAIVLVTGVAGAFVLHRQGTAALARAMAEAGQGRAPVGAVLEGAFLVVAGALLLSPGLITDALGLLLLVPPLRGWIARRVLAWALASPAVEVGVFTVGDGPRPAPPGGGETIEGEFERVEERTLDPRRRADRPGKPDRD